MRGKKWEKKNIPSKYVPINMYTRKKQNKHRDAIV